jgi:hypothetical protein
MTPKLPRRLIQEGRWLLHEETAVVLTFAAAVEIVAALALASSGRSSSTGSPQPSPTKLPSAAPAGQMMLYGHIKTLKRVGGRVEMRFHPAGASSGPTARRASLADTGSSLVPNDHYYIEAGHRLLTYIVAPTATIRVLTNTGTGRVDADQARRANAARQRPATPEPLRALAHGRLDPRQHRHDPRDQPAIPAITAPARAARGSDNASPPGPLPTGREPRAERWTGHGLAHQTCSRLGSGNDCRLGRAS